MTGLPSSRRDANGVDRWVRRRVGIVWGLLIFDCLGSQPGATLLQLPRPVQQATTYGSLIVALVLVITVNPRLVVRPNIVMGLFTLLLIVAATTSVRGTAGPGSYIRIVRFGGFLAVLWLLTPFWGRRDLLLVRCHLRALVVVSISVLVGLVLAPGLALSGGVTGRLVGTIWPIPAPQVAGYAAVAAGLTLMLWLSGWIGRTPTLLVWVGAVTMLLMSHTRTAIAGLVISSACGSLALFIAHPRVRRLSLVLLVGAVAAFVLFAPQINHWFTRGQTATDLASLTGRRTVWDGVRTMPRSEFNQWFGFGLSNKSHQGLSIDSTWLAVYQEEGVVGDIIVAAIYLFMILAPAFHRPGTGRAIAVLLVVYCLVVSYTEVGIGDASPYILHIIAALSALAPRNESVYSREPVVP